jgi:hypothetical protein
MALFLDLLFLHFRVCATLKGLAVGFSVLLGWRIIMSVDAAVQARKRLQGPAQSVPMAATLGAMAIVVARSVVAIYKLAQSASRLPCFPHILPARCARHSVKEIESSRTLGAFDRKNRNAETS